MSEKSIDNVFVSNSIIIIAKSYDSMIGINMVGVFFLIIRSVSTSVHDFHLPIYLNE